VAERSGDTAFARTLRERFIYNSRPHESRAEVTAFQTLARLTRVPTSAKRVECGAFTAAFVLLSKNNK
jgi:hypothetical protein